MTEVLGATIIERTITSYFENDEYFKLNLLFEKYGKRFYEANNEIIRIIPKRLLEHLKKLILGPMFIQVSVDTRESLVSGITSLMFYLSQVLKDEDVGEYVLSFFEFTQKCIYTDYHDVEYLVKKKKGEAELDSDANEAQTNGDAKGTKSDTKSSAPTDNVKAKVTPLSDEEKLELDRKLKDEAVTMGILAPKLFGCIGALLSSMSKGKKLNQICRIVIYRSIFRLCHFDPEVVCANARLLALIYEIFEYEKKNEPKFQSDYKCNNNAPYYHQEMLVEVCGIYFELTDVEFTEENKQKFGNLLNRLKSTILVYTSEIDREIMSQNSSKAASCKKRAMEPFEVEFLESVVNIDTWSQYAKYAQLMVCYPNGFPSVGVHLNCIYRILKKPNRAVKSFKPENTKKRNKQKKRK